MMPDQTEEKQEMLESEQKRYERYDALRIAIVVLPVCMLLFTFCLRVMTVDGSSMLPTLTDGEWMLVVDSFLAGEPEAGDVVVLRVPTYNETTPIVKRVIATEGQTVDIDYEAGTVSVDGEVLDEPYINEQMVWLAYDTYWDYPVTVEEGCIFVLGDNRNHSSDSRYFAIGMVNTNYVVGKAVFALWPLSWIGVIA